MIIAPLTTIKQQIEDDCRLYGISALVGDQVKFVCSMIFRSSVNHETISVAYQMVGTTRSHSDPDQQSSWWAAKTASDLDCDCEVNVNLIRIMFGFWVSPTILNICSACELWESRPASGCNRFNVSCVSLSPEVRKILRSRQTPSQLQHSIDKMFSSFSDSPRLSLLHFDVTDRFLTSMNQIRAWRGPPSLLS